MSDFAVSMELNSNIVQLFTLLKKDDKDVQMVYYQVTITLNTSNPLNVQWFPGGYIGTYTSPNIATPLMTKLSKTLDEMVAWNLDRHVMDAVMNS
ncbi:hypothetical protein CCMSSC00406_0007642 [Pleurotus cornucopiae]|uniref:Uncharacterized protein n=1 Tax=Pleurotus cornucopiae TaxID=5321 RepID=A0ACB7J353_PLECO|nr:hypothetical protein CCMSSC00406_0007642 [Pleurotus cornucopiae]